ncbi:MAG: restriction endonuclease subunit S [Acidobacteria bacterium]|nr:restriction endonuclease subunit S [Acidobacteriota bacterium]
MSEEQRALPEGWLWATVGDLVLDVQPGFASGKKGVEGGIRHLRMNNIGPNCMVDLSQVTTVPADLAKEHHLIRPGDVLFCHTNSQKLVGKSALFKADDGPYAYSNHLTRLRLPPDGPPPEWLSYALANLWRDRYFETRCKHWVNQATVERDTLLFTPVPVAPLAEQRRIVAKIEALFEQSRTARAALDRIPPLLKRFRQSVLAAAFRGDLTRDWREQHPDVQPASALLDRIRTERRRKWDARDAAKPTERREGRYEQANSPDASQLQSLPESWTYARVREVSRAIQYGYTQRGMSEPIGPKFLRITDIQEGRVDWQKVPYCEISTQDLQKYSLEKGDIVFARSGATTGKSYMIWERPPAVFASYLIRVKLFAQVLPEYMYTFFQTQAYWDQITTRGNAQPNANAQVLGGIVFPLAPIAEQKEIVASITALLQQVEAIGAAVEPARRRSEKLEQAILARAFRGELVSQDPNDEPASTLLDRIRRENPRRTHRPNRRAGRLKGLPL